MRTLLWCLLLLTAPLLAAQSLVCKVDAKGDTPLRKGGAVLLEMILTNKSAGIVEGRMEAAVLRGGKPVTRVTSEMVLPPGITSTQMLLPPALNPAFGEGYAVRLSFLQKGAVVPLGDHQLGRYALGGDEFFIGAVRTTRRLSDIDRLREQSARLESMRPALERSAWAFTHIRSVPVERLPGQVAGWTAWDLVLVDAGALAEMSARQFDMLARWIEGGGMALVFAEGAIRERAFSFLQRMAGDQETLSLDGSGKLVSPRPRRFAAGLGRVLVAPTPPSDKRDLGDGNWLAHLGWLWGVRAEWLPHIAKEGVWPVDRPLDASDNAWDSSWGARHETWLRGVLEQLGRDSQRKPQALPLSFVGALLACLLVLAGPGEWLVLGWLRRRRWTWVTFPMVCFLFAWGASRLAWHYLGQNSRVTWITFTEVGEGDRALRQIRFELRVPARDEEWTSEVVDGVATPWGGLEPDEGGVRSSDSAEARETRSDWVAPSKMILRENLRQWTPNRRQEVAFPAAGKLFHTPDWRELMRRWRSYQRERELAHLAAPLGDFQIYFVPEEPKRAWTLGQRLPASSSLQEDHVQLLSRDLSSAADVLGRRSPMLLAQDMIPAAPRGSLAIFAWRQTGDGLQILRRHVSAGELEAER